jgi:1,2-dihydroxy-3-keto-5-methylthiopentene dioxygenase
MTTLTVLDAATAAVLAEHTAPDALAAALAAAGVGYERWVADRVLPADAASADVLAAYAADVARLCAAHGFVTADVVRMHPTHPDCAALRAKFLDEHTHAEPEVRFFVEGEGLFVLHPPPGPDGDRVYALRAVAGDLVHVPAGMRHWFDMGEHPRFCAIRLFTNPEGWVARYTGDRIADRFPRLPTGAPA